MKAPLEQPRRFSVDDANRMLPLVGRIVSDIVSLSEEMDKRQDRLDALSGEVSDIEALSQIQQEIDADESRLEEYVAELVKLGVELQDAVIGEVDFPIRIEGREAYLCWRLGEPEVAHWHWEDTGFESRQLLLQGAAYSDGFPPPETTNP